MKNKWLILAGAVTVAAFSTAQANLITGNIGFAGNVVLDTGTAATATIAESYSGATTPDPTVSSASGYISTLAPAGTQIAFTHPWTFYPGSSIAITPFWTSTLANGLMFSLTSWTATRGVTLGGEAYVAISGVGTMSDSIGDTPNTYNFVVTLQDPPSNPGNDTFTFSASQAPVPDGGSTAALLGLALSAIGLVFVRNRKARCA